MSVWNFYVTYGNWEKKSASISYGFTLQLKLLLISKREGKKGGIEIRVLFGNPEIPTRYVFIFGTVFRFPLQQWYLTLDVLTVKQQIQSKVVCSLRASWICSGTSHFWEVLSKPGGMQEVGQILPWFQSTTVEKERASPAAGKRTEDMTLQGEKVIQSNEFKMKSSSLLGSVQTFVLSGYHVPILKW